MMPKTLVVPLDGSDLAERAVHVAVPLADRLGADVVLASATFGNERARRDYLWHVAKMADGVRFDTVVTPDAEPAEVIADAVHDHPDAMLCMTTHGRGRLRWAVSGSVAEDLLRRSLEPVLLVGPRGEDTWSRPAHRVVVCVDGSDAARVATHHACDWAKALDLEVHLVFATHPLDVESSESPGKVFGPFEDIVSAEGLRVQRDQLFRSSFIGGALADFADDPPATLMVMAAHRHGPVARSVLGSTTMAVLNVTTCPVLVIPSTATIEGRSTDPA